MRSRVARWVIACVMVGVPSVVAAQTPPVGPVERARQVAVQGRHAEALVMLDTHLAANAGDIDARTLRGTVRSWAGQYAEARADLEAVLLLVPDHGDALPALARVELWSGHPEVAEALAARGLATHPESLALMEIRALALERLRRYSEGRVQIEALLARNASDPRGRRIQRRLVDKEPGVVVGVSYRHDRFDQSREPWHEAQAFFGAQGGAGMIGVRVYAADRFGLRDEMFEVEAYPRLGERAYAYLAGAFATDPTLYPERRFVADLYQTVGTGWEISAGVRLIDPAAPDATLRPARVMVYTGALQRYAGTWLVGVRGWYVPEATADSGTLDALLRRYRVDGQSYLGAKYSRGRYREDERVAAGLSDDVSDALSVEAAQRTGRLLWTASAGARRDSVLPGASGHRWQRTLLLGVRAKF